jgi:S-DNA-T family DNA segregation ATPase FtsK/SpoIIIE
MAKKAKRGRPAGSGKKKKEEAKAIPGFWRGFGAVSLIIIGIVLWFGAFINAPIPKDLWNAFWWAFGGAAIIAPVVLIYLGGLKFISEDQRIPFHKILGATALMVFFASWLHTAFLHTSADSLSLVGGHGGNIGKSAGDAMVGALGKFLSSLIFFILTIFAALFTFGVEPRSLLALLEMFKREKPEGEEDSEDLANLKKKMTPFQLHEGVPVEHNPAARMANLRNTAQKLAPDQDHAALTTASDPDWQYPSLTLLSDKQDKADAGDVTGNAETIKDTFENFNIDVEVEGANVGPRVTQFTIKPPTGVKLTKLTALEDNLKLDLAAHSIRMEAPIPGKRAVGVEVPNVKAATVTIHGLLSSSDWRDEKGQLGFVIGKDITGNPIVGDLERMPHLLIAGQTPSRWKWLHTPTYPTYWRRSSPSRKSALAP